MCHYLNFRTLCRNLVTHFFTIRQNGLCIVKQRSTVFHSTWISSFGYCKVAGMIPTTTVWCDGGFLPIHLFSITAFPGDDIKMFWLYSTVNAAYCTNNIEETGYWKEYIVNDKKNILYSLWYQAYCCSHWTRWIIMIRLNEMMGLLQPF